MKTITHKKSRTEAYKIIDEELDLTDDDIYVLKRLPITDRELLKIVKELQYKANYNEVVMHLHQQFNKSH